MAITGNDILVIMREVGIDSDIVDQLKLDLPLLKQGLDSIDLPVVAVATEKKYGIDLSKMDATNFKTINDFVAFLNRKLQ